MKISARIWIWSRVKEKKSICHGYNFDAVDTPGLVVVVAVVVVVVVMPHSLHRSCYSRYLCFITFIQYYDIFYIILYLYCI